MKTIEEVIQEEKRELRWLWVKEILFGVAIGLPLWLIILWSI